MMVVFSLWWPAWPTSKDIDDDKLVMIFVTMEVAMLSMVLLMLMMLTMTLLTMTMMLMINLWILRVKLLMPPTCFSPLERLLLWIMIRSVHSEAMIMIMAMIIRI